MTTRAHPGMATMVLEARRTRDLSLHDLARMADVPSSAIRALEAGDAVPDAHVAAVAMALLGTPMVPVVGIDGPWHPLGEVAMASGTTFVTDDSVVTWNVDGSRTLRTFVDPVPEVPSRRTWRVEARIVAAALASYATLYLSVRMHLPDVVLLGWAMGPCTLASVLLIPVFGRMLDESLGWHGRDRQDAHV